MLDLQNLDCSGVVFFIERQHIVRISFKVRRQFVQTDKRSVSNCSSTWFGVLISALESFWREHSKWCVPQTPLVKVRGGAFGSVWFSSIQLAWTAFRVRSVIHTSSKAMRWRGDGYHCHRPTAAVFNLFWNFTSGKKTAVSPPNSLDGFDCWLNWMVAIVCARDNFGVNLLRTCGLLTVTG